MTRPRTAIRAAATVAVLRDGRGGLEVLLLRRAASHVFAASAHVYPGGAVDTADAAPALVARCTAGDQGDHDGQSDLAYRIAAIRECFEEAGLLIACADTAASDDDGERALLRAALNADDCAWIDVTERLGLYFEPERLVYFDYRVTPAGAPRRYATRFFAARAPTGQQAAADGHETDSAWWARPADALALHANGRIELMTPTRATLARLADHADVESALAGLARSARTSA